jgi:hypothetical protein
MRPASASRALFRTPSSDVPIGRTPSVDRQLPRTTSRGGMMLNTRSGSMGIASASTDRGMDLASPKSEQSSVSPVLESKFSRKRAETDLQLLANRIALLKLEEQKALQKVQDTKVRAEEILE